VISLEVPRGTAAWSPGLLPGPYEPAGRGGSATTDPAPKPRARARSARPQDLGRLSDMRSSYVDPLQNYVSKLLEDQRARGAALAQVHQRLATLKVQALLQEEPFSEASLADLIEFLRELPFVQRPALFLLDNGNLRAVWKNDWKEQIGLQFLGGQIVQFVIFSLRADPPMMARIAGAETMGNIVGQIKANAAEHLLRR
jgi:hypothetical protein